MCLFFSLSSSFRFTVIRYLSSERKNFDKLNRKTNAHVLLSMSVRECITSLVIHLYTSTKADGRYTCPSYRINSSDLHRFQNYPSFTVITIYSNKDKSFLRRQSWISAVSVPFNYSCASLWVNYLTIVLIGSFVARCHLQIPMA